MAREETETEGLLAQGQKDQGADPAVHHITPTYGQIDEREGWVGGRAEDAGARWDFCRGGCGQLYPKSAMVSVGGLPPSCFSCRSRLSETTHQQWRERAPPQDMGMGGYWHHKSVRDRQWRVWGMRTAVVLLALTVVTYFYIESRESESSSSSNSDVSKNTWAASDTTVTYDWFITYLDCKDADDSCSDNICTCGSQGRVSLTGDGFGVHTVNTSQAHCTDSALRIEEVERYFAAKLDGLSSFDAFMDYNLGLWAKNLDHYVRMFDDDGVSYYTLDWEQEGATYYSVFVWISGSQVVLELMGNATLLTATTTSSIPRLSTSGINSASTSSMSLYPVKVSRASSDLARDEEVYEAVGASKLDARNSTDVSMVSFTWPDSSTEIQFWNRPDSATSGDFKVSDFETGLKAVHSACVQSEFCGFDEWFDNHYAYDGYTYLDDTLDKIKSKGYTHFIWKLSASTTSYEESMSYSIYWVDGTGMAVQLDGKFHDEPNAPEYSTQLCSDGNC